MANPLQKQTLSIHTPRLMTGKGIDADSLIHFRDSQDDEMADTPLTIRYPDGWSALAAELFAEKAFCHKVPAETRSVEENTLPSWLWKHKALGKSLAVETDVAQVFRRAVGSATYNGWKEGLFANEESARDFYDETRYALLQRFVAIRPDVLATAGLDWAYGTKKTTDATAPVAVADKNAITISNTEIDSIIGGSAKAATRAKWQKIITTPKEKAQKNFARTLRFTDTATEWEVAHNSGARAFIDLMACRHNDGTINIDAIKQRTHILVTLLDLGNITTDHLAIGFTNLAALLLALALPYDSKAARATASAIAAIITAEATIASAKLAAMRGMSKFYVAHREKVARNLRNHHRAAHGDKNDYEKISILPTPLSLQNCPDLALVAAAQRCWDDAIESVQRHGLRHTHVTSVSISAEGTLFMSAASSGTEPMLSLCPMTASEDGSLRRDLHPSASEALTRLGYSDSERQTIARHILGHGTLKAAPAINHSVLRGMGIDDVALMWLEDYLPHVRDIRLAFTPWILGEALCRDVLKIPSRKLQNPAFDLLAHLGFDDESVAAANAYCYGHNDVRNVPGLNTRHRSVFATGHAVSASARSTMAAAVQSFVSDDVGAHVSLPANLPPADQEKFILDAWRAGLHSIAISHDAPVTKLVHRAQPQKEKMLRAKKSALLANTRSPLPNRTNPTKAGARILSLTKGKAVPGQGIKRH